MSSVQKNINCGGERLSLKQFDPERLHCNNKGEYVNPRIAIVAKSGSGKSWVIRDIMYHLRNIPSGCVIAPADKYEKFYDEFIPSIFKHDEMDISIMHQVINRQKMEIEKNEERIKKGNPPLDTRAFLIMDDCMADGAKWVKEPITREIFFQGRHFGLTFILSMQYIIGIGPELRSNFDFIFLLAEDSFLNRKKIYEGYASIFPNFDIFDQVFTQVTDDYGCMVIDKREKSNDITKKVFWYKAKKRDDFKVGSEKIWKFNELNYDQNYMKKTPLLDLNNYVGGRKNKPQIIVQKNNI